MLGSNSLSPTSTSPHLLLFEGSALSDLPSRFPLDGPEAQGSRFLLRARPADAEPVTAQARTGRHLAQHCEDAGRAYRHSRGDAALPRSIWLPEAFCSNRPG